MGGGPDARGGPRRNGWRVPVIRHRQPRRLARSRDVLPDPRRAHQPGGDRASARGEQSRADRRRRRRGRAESGPDASDRLARRSDRARGDELPRRCRRLARLRSLLAQLSPVPGATQANAQRAAEIVVGADVDLVVLPELWLSGYGLDRIYESAVELGSSELGVLRQSAADTATAIVVGFPERRGDSVANAV